MTLVSITRDDDIAIVTVNNPPVNALGQQLREELWNAVGRLDDDPLIRGVVLTCAGRTFIAGADVNEFDKAPVPPHLPDLVARIENARLPWLAAIHGAALGGGLEVALGCRFRVAVAGASLGFPEVNLGVIPGASGTVRTPRLVGVSAAVDLITTGRPIKAKRALVIGLIDEVVEGDLVSAAIVWLRRALDGDLPPALARRPLQQQENAFWEERHEEVARRAKGALAPLKALESLKFATEHSFAEAMAFERETFLALRGSRQAAALRHVFFAERATQRPSDLRGMESRPFERIGVVGGGTMGVGIAASLLDAGFPVVLIERDSDAAQRALGNLRATFDGAIKRGKVDEAEAEGRLGRCSASSNLQELAEVDLVIEAVFEDIAVKRDLFIQLDAVCRPDAILATNTSYLDPRMITEGVSNPQRLIGLHFFSPANIMKLLEIVPLPQTDDPTRSAAFALARRLGKIPVQAGICEGFIGNRILKRYRAAAEAMVRRGAAIAEIDGAMRDYGFAMGPFEAQDLGGLDIAHAQRQAARAAGTQVPQTLGDMLVDAGRKGQKVGAGWYDYAAGSRTPLPSAAVEELLAGSVVAMEALSRGKIAEHLVSEMASEGEVILAEGVARNPADIDLVEIHGYGFPRWRGGPMFAQRTNF